MFSSRALKGCVPERIDPAVGHQTFNGADDKPVQPLPPRPGLGPGVAVNEKELVARFVPPSQISKPASTEIRFEDESTYPRRTASLMKAKMSSCVTIPSLMAPVLEVLRT